MITSEDFIWLPFPPDLAQAGILYACRRLSRLHSPQERAVYDLLRRVAASAAAELAFRRHLTETGLFFEVMSPAPFSARDSHAIRIGRRACMLKSFLISESKQTKAIELEPHIALRAPALVPYDRFGVEALTGDQAYVFAFVLATVAEEEPSPLGATGADGHHWLHILPATWRQPRIWSPLGPIVATSTPPEVREVELGGEDASGQFQAVRLRLESASSMAVEVPFHTLQYLHAEALPGAPIILEIPAWRRTHKIATSDWKDVALAGRGILVLGWLPRDQYRARARVIQSGTAVFQFNTTRTKNFAVDVAELWPLSRLLDTGSSH